VVACPECATDLELGDVHFAGMPIFVESRCPECGRRFYVDWPAGHALLHPVAIDCETGVVYAQGAEWYARHAATCFRSQGDPASAEIAIRGECRAGGTAVLVDCIDYLYGHVLLKLLSAPRHIRDQPDEDVVVIVPKLLAWLVPPGVVAIEVDLPLSHGVEWVAGLDAAVKDLLRSCAAIRISAAISQPDPTMDELALLGLDPAPWNTTARDDTSLQIGFILRDDRLWSGRSSLPLRVARLLLPHRIIQRLQLRRQARNYAMLARRIHARYPQARLIALGIGQPGGLPGAVEDLRTPGPIPESEWLEEYRRCRVIVGVHGSALLLPSLLAGAVVDLVPDWKLDGAFGTDLIIPRGTVPDPKLYLFRYRMLPETSSPDAVAAHVLSILDGADFQYRNLVENRRAYETGAWQQPLSWRHIDLPQQ
jgi:hypothetical protein